MKINNLIKRFISGISLASLILISIFVYRSLFYILACVLAVLMLIEWRNMIKNVKGFLYDTIGIVLIITPITSILIISYLDMQGWLLLTLFVCISTVDVMAMFGGKLIGGKKLAPVISPNKTISGLLIGTCSSCITVNCLTLLSSYQLPMELHKNNILLTLCIFVLGITAQLSDLLISYFKRKFNIKDTGNIIPGHGGVLDRFDSIILTAPLLLALYLTSNF